MKSKYVIPVAILIVVWLGVLVSFGVQTRNPWHPDRYAATYHAAINGFQNTMVTVYRISPRPIPPEERGKRPAIAGFEILDEKVLSSDAFGDVLQRLTQQGTYDSEGAKCFDPGMAVRFSSSNGEELTAVICLDCLWVKWVQANQSDSIPLSQLGAKNLLAFYQWHFPGPKPKTAIVP